MISNTPKITPRIAAALLGQTVLAPLESRADEDAFAPCEVVDFTMEWGRVRLILKPIGGQGQTKVNAERIKVIP